MAITYRLVKGSAITAAEYDATLTDLVGQIAGKCDDDDARLSDARTPTSHSHPISDITNLQTTLDGLATDGDLAALQTEVDGKVADSDARLTDARDIADGDYTDFTVASGVATATISGFLNGLSDGESADYESIASTLAGYIAAALAASMPSGGYVKVLDAGGGFEAKVPTSDTAAPGECATTGSFALDFTTPRIETSGDTTGNITITAADNLPVNGQGDLRVTFGGSHSITWPSGWNTPGGGAYSGTSGDKVHFVLYRVSDSPDEVDVMVAAPIQTVS